MRRFSASGARLHELRQPKPTNAAFRQGRPPQSHGFSLLCHQVPSHGRFQLWENPNRTNLGADRLAHKKIWIRQRAVERCHDERPMLRGNSRLIAPRYHEQGRPPRQRSANSYQSGSRPSDCSPIETRISGLTLQEYTTPVTSSCLDDAKQCATSRLEAASSRRVAPS